MIEYLTILLNARFARTEERGASAVEYGLLVAGIAAVIVAVVFLLGGNIQAAFTGVNNQVGGAGAGAGGGAN